jgi:hypothetical protein
MKKTSGFSHGGCQKEGQRKDAHRGKKERWVKRGVRVVEEGKSREEGELVRERERDGRGLWSPWDSSFTHACLDTVLRQQCLVAAARIFTASVRVVAQLSSWSPLKQCHMKCGMNQCCIVMHAHRPSHYFARVGIQYPSQKKPPFLRLQMVKSGIHFSSGALAEKFCFKRLGASGKS